MSGLLHLGQGIILSGFFSADSDLLVSSSFICLLFCNVIVVPNSLIPPSSSSYLFLSAIIEREREREAERGAEREVVWGIGIKNGDFIIERKKGKRVSEEREVGEKEKKRFGWAFCTHHCFTTSSLSSSFFLFKHYKNMMIIIERRLLMVKRPASNGIENETVSRERFLFVS